MNNSKITLPYELSLWEDKFATGIIEKDDGTTEEKHYLDEVKIMEIGSDTSSFPGKAFNIIFNRNINAINDLTFSLVDSYYDPKTKEKVKNPLVDKIFNRTRVKLKYGEDEAGAPQWYDFIITEKTESKSEGKIIHTYICTDRWVDELSRTGYEILLTEENGIGDIDYLANKILEGSSFKYTPAKEGEFKETKIERKLVNGELVEEIKDVDVKISEYNKELGRIVDRYQYIYLSEGEEIVSDTFEGKELWGYSTSDMVFSGGVRNWLYNGKDFVDTDGWFALGDLDEENNATVESCEITNPSTSENYFLRVKPNLGRVAQSLEDKHEYFSLSNNTMKNAEFIFDPNTQYVFYMKYSYENFNKNIGSTFGPTIQFNFSSSAEYGEGDILPPVKLTDDRIAGNKEKEFYYIFTPKNKVRGGYLNLSFENTTLSEDIKDNKIRNSYDLIELSFFPVELKTNGKISYNNTILSPSQFVSSVANKIILPEENEPISFLKQRTYLFIKENENIIKYVNPSSTFDVQKIEYKYKKENIKTRTLIKEKSNRYTLLQELAELFEGWMKISPKYYQNGKIKINKDFTYENYISFSENTEKETGKVFEYGKNINSIERNINSKEIVSKLWVQESENTDSETGLTSIASAEDNQLGDIFIYDFSYYLNHGFIDKENFYKNAYEENAGFYSKSEALKNILIEAQESQRKLYNDIVSKLFTEREENILKIQAYKEKSVSACNVFSWNQPYNDKSQTLYGDKKILFKGSYYTAYATGTIDGYLYNSSSYAISNPEEFGDNYEDKENSELIRDYYKRIQYYGREIEGFYLKVLKLNKLLGYKEFLDNDETIPNDLSYSTLEDGEKDEIPFNDNDYENENASYLPRYRSYEKKINELKKEKETLTKEFELNYAGFINDGTWSDDNYTDSNAYYLDALAVLKKSAKPTVSYTIDVAKTDRDYKIGDKIPLIDRDLFGFDSYGAPTKEMMVLTEISDTIDSSEDFSITVQNFRSEFEDFFSKISASVQTVQSKDGMYSRAANFTPTGQISPSVLQNTLNNNNIVLNGGETGITTDKNGITLKSNENKSKIVKIIADGIFASKDGGTNWTTGITADGISGSFITAGQLNTSLVQIMNKEVPSFKWDALGITAEEMVDQIVSSATPFTGAIVRMDQHGLYFVAPANKNKFDYNNLSENDSTRVPWFQSKISLANYLDDNGNISREGRLGFVRDNADVSLTWKGLLIKSSDGTSQLSTEANNITIKNGTNENAVDRIILGKNKDSDYGLFVYNNNGDKVFSTDESGNLTISGTVYAEGGEFTGIITAEEGQIGNWYIRNGGIDNGKIFLDSSFGNSGSIYMLGEDGSKKWSIDGTGRAAFENATINGTLSATYFKYNEIQASSGAILVRPAAKIVNWNREEPYYVTLDSEASLIDLQTDDYFVIQTIAGDKYYGFVSEANSGSPLVNISWLYDEDFIPNNEGIFPTSLSYQDISNLLNGTLINLGRNKDTSIVINGGKEKAFGFGESITFYRNQLKTLSGTSYLDKNYTTVLGNLEGIGKSGFGLYSDNVYLKGDFFNVKDNYEQTRKIPDIIGHSLEVVSQNNNFLLYPFSNYHQKFDPIKLNEDFNFNFYFSFSTVTSSTLNMQPSFIFSNNEETPQNTSNGIIKWNFRNVITNGFKPNQIYQFTLKKNKGYVSWVDSGQTYSEEIVPTISSDFDFNNVLGFSLSTGQDSGSSYMIYWYTISLLNNTPMSFDLNLSSENILSIGPYDASQQAINKEKYLQITSGGQTFIQDLAYAKTSSGKIDAGSLSDLLT